tara:strand:+ start:584 stop:736 length:153 start_codon:yes stop_codon:yes gene_type:complete
MTICIVVHHTSNPEVEIISYVSDVSEISTFLMETANTFDFNQVEISYDKN